MKVLQVITFTLGAITSMHLHAIEVVDVDVELQLLVDISGSVNNTEYQLQMGGYKGAFESDSVKNAIINGGYGQIAVQLIMWSGSSQQQVMIDWTLIDSASASDAFAATIDTLTRPFSGLTAIGSAINYGSSQFITNNFSGLSQVIDVSGDGTNNSGMSPSSARDAAIASGVDKINGIVITSRQSVIDQYANEVVTGDNAFLLAPATFSDFQSAIETKIASEIQGVAPPGNLIVSIPEPNSSYLILIALALLYSKNLTSIKLRS